MQIELWQFTSFIIGLLSLIGVMGWRSSQQRQRIYERIDSIRDHARRDYVRKDVFEVIIKQQESKLYDFKKELDEIKVKVEMIPAMSNDLRLLVKRAGLEHD